MNSDPLIACELSTPYIAPPNDAELPVNVQSTTATSPARQKRAAPRENIAAALALPRSILNPSRTAVASWSMQEAT